MRFLTGTLPNKSREHSWKLKKIRMHQLNPKDPISTTSSRSPPLPFGDTCPLCNVEPETLTHPMACHAYKDPLRRAELPLSWSRLHPLILDRSSALQLATRASTPNMSHFSREELLSPTHLEWVGLASFSNPPAKWHRHYLSDHLSALKRFYLLWRIRNWIVHNPLSPPPPPSTFTKL